MKKSHNQKQTVSEPNFLVIRKIITRSFFIRLRPFFLRCFRNSVTDVFTEGSESRFCTEQSVVFTGGEILPLYLIFDHSTNQIYKSLITLILGLAIHFYHFSIITHSFSLKFPNPHSKFYHQRSTNFALKFVNLRTKPSSIYQFLTQLWIRFWF